MKVFGYFHKQFKQFIKKVMGFSASNIKNEIKPLQNKELLETVASNYTDKFLKAAEKPIKNLHATKGKRTKLRCPNGTRKKCIKR